METLMQNLQSKTHLTDYREQNRLMKHEADILDEIIAAAENGHPADLDWFVGFGDSLRSILMNVHAYRKGTEFGFTEISFDKYGWFSRPSFLDKEDLIFGNPDKYGEHSVLHIGRGILPVWTYALNYTYGTAGGGSALSVYGKQFKNREAAVNAGLKELKDNMKSKIGNTDTTNYKQPVILGTLKAIVNFETEQVQLSLF